MCLGFYWGQGREAGCGLCGGETGRQGAGPCVGHRMETWSHMEETPSPGGLFPHPSPHTLDTVRVRPFHR